MANSDYPDRADRFPKRIERSDGTVNVDAEDFNLIQDAIVSIQKILGDEPSLGQETVKDLLKRLNEDKVEKGTPISLNTRTVENQDGEKELEVSFSYVEDEDIDHFVLEVWDEGKQRYVPYDNKLGIIRK